MLSWFKNVPVTPPSDALASTVHLAIQPRLTSHISTVSPIALLPLGSLSLGSVREVEAVMNDGVVDCRRGLASSSVPLPPPKSSLETTAISVGKSGRQSTRRTGNEGCRVYVGWCAIWTDVPDVLRSQTYMPISTYYALKGRNQHALTVWSKPPLTTQLLSAPTTSLVLLAPGVLHQSRARIGPACATGNLSSWPLWPVPRSQR